MVSEAKSPLAPTVRILLRYGSGFLAGKGIFTPELADQLSTDPQVIDLMVIALTHTTDWLLVTVAAGVAAATEWFYKFAKKRGWAT